MRSAPLRLLGSRALSLTTLLLILAAPALAANPPVAYETTVSGYTLDSGRGVAMAPDGSATVIGRMVGETQDSDILIFRVDREGALRVFDARGGLVRTLTTASFAAGSHEILWDGRDDAGRAAASGVYLAQLRAGQEQRVRKLALVR